MISLIVFCKYPRLGKVKTRISIDSGEVKALEIHQELMLGTLKLIQNLQPYFNLFWFWDLGKDDISKEKIKINIPDSIQVKKQTSGDLGWKMFKAFEEVYNLYDNKFFPVLIIGSDAPTLDVSILELARKLLQDNDFVLGPSADGGYYLLGMNQLFPSLFQNIEWSTERVLDQTLEKIESLKKSYKLLPTLSDIDTFHDYKNWKTSY